ncbi:hypothetical protein LV780_18085 [Cereibacter azotoformans]|uniref:hypothetical protein n=1 Tax=Cereibacter azotoformans TaxID=43057 RepID=UPI000E35D37B|nr:hypothetical protein [Cereibacter azotoformans]AXQ95509.1 hypothetical protein D0Z66_17180 [Cereibacter sphaeroides]UIJ32247.1 hypothetical protein LV780_18085 [Cereibacter azotoformans]
MKLVRDAKTLKTKAIHSLKAGMTAFNRFEEEGRITSVLLHSQHACEMLLKAVLVQRNETVFDLKTGKSIGFERCVCLCTAKHGLTEQEAGIMRAMDSLRDAAQHWFVVVAEDILYLNVRALITAFDEYLKRALGDDLRSHIPPRVLPVSTMPPGDFEFLVDREYKVISELLQPGRRARDEARARIRSLLAMEAVAVEESEVSEMDIGRIEKAIRAGAEVNAVFPRLATIGTRVEGEGLTLTVHFSKKEGAPVRYIGGDDPTDAAAVRTLDLQKKFHLSRTVLAEKLGLTPPKAKLLRDHLGIDTDPSCHHAFEFGKQRIPQYSDNAVRTMKAWLTANDIGELWRTRDSC